MRDRIPDPAKRSILAELKQRAELKSHPIVGQRIRDEDELDRLLLAELAELRRNDFVTLRASEFSDDPDLQSAIPY